MPGSLAGWLAGWLAKLRWAARGEDRLVKESGAMDHLIHFFVCRLQVNLLSDLILFNHAFSHSLPEKKRKEGLFSY